MASNRLARPLFDFDETGNLVYIKNGGYEVNEGVSKLLCSICEMRKHSFHEKRRWIYCVYVLSVTDVCLSHSCEYVNIH